MRGVTETRLQDIAEEYSGHPYGSFLLRLIHEECKDLIQWQPIDTAPKDRLVMLYYPGTQKQNRFQRIDFYSGETEMCCSPTHWMELPRPPK